MLQLYCKQGKSCLRDLASVQSFQVLIKPKPVFQTAVVSEQTRQLVTETLQQVTRSADSGQVQTLSQDVSSKDDSGEVPHGSVHGTSTFSSLFGSGLRLRPLLSFLPCPNMFIPPLDLFLPHFLELPPVVHVVSTREQDWTEQEVSVESSPTIIYQEVSGGESQSATSTIKALLELQQTTGRSLCGRCTGGVM